MSSAFCSTPKSKSNIPQYSFFASFIVLWSAEPELQSQKTSVHSNMHSEISSTCICRNGYLFSFHLFINSLESHFLYPIYSKSTVLLLLSLKLYADFFLFGKCTSVWIYTETHTCTHMHVSVNIYKKKYVFSLFKLPWI